MKTVGIIRTITLLLILLFTYTAVSKLTGFETFRGQMLNQPLPEPLSSLLVWAVPLAELLAVVLLMIKRFRLAGLWSALVLMSVLSAYVALVLFHAFDRVPCSCGGILKSLSWEGHLMVNFTFWLLSLAGIVLTTYNRKKKYRDSLPMLAGQAKKGESRKPLTE